MFWYFYDFPKAPNVNTSNSLVPFDMTLFEIETWLTIGLSSLSFITILIVTIIYILTHLISRDKAKETKSSVLRKLVKNEYLVMSYCLSLLISHLITLLHKLASKYFVNGYVRTDLMCFVVGVLKHFLWLSCLFHSNAISFKIYLKLSKTMNGDLVHRKNWLISASKIFFYIYGSTSIISACSIAIHFGVKESKVYELSRYDKINSCFLSQPLYLIVFFAFPVLIILSMNLTLFLIVYLKTRTTLDSSQSSDGNKLFLKLAIIMGLSWFVYVIGVILTEIIPNHLAAQIIVLITSCQVNLQGFTIVLGLFWSACYEFLFKRKEVKNRGNKKYPNPGNNKIIDQKVHNITVL